MIYLAYIICNCERNNSRIILLTEIVNSLVDEILIYLSELNG